MLRLPPRTLVLAFMLTASFALPACNTVKGFGEDLTALGNKITGTAEKHR
jgi:predicted small secreted protein